METIRNVIRVHKNYWDCFERSILYDGNSPEIRYEFVAVENPGAYQTRNMYPKQDTARFDTILNDLITGKLCPWRPC